MIEAYKFIIIHFALHVGTKFNSNVGGAEWGGLSIVGRQLFWRVIEL